jgi:leucyl aminopeptidase
MNVAVVVAALEAFETPLLAVAVPKQGKALPAPLARLDAALAGVLSRLFASGEFAGGRDECAVVYATGVPAGRVLLVGMGKPEEVGRTAVRRAAAVAARRAKALGTGSLALAVPAEFRGVLAAAELGQVVVEGAEQGVWLFDEYKAEKAEDKKPPVGAFTLLVDAADAAEATKGSAVGSAIAAGQALTRRLQVLPPNVCTPAYLAEAARELGRAHGFTVTVLEKPAIEAEGMGALLAVNQGSATEPRFIVLEYRGAGDAAPVALVGKGITFDSGGISIKPAASMEDMKYDMSGAAAVLGAMDATGRLKPALNVVGVIPATDNMPGGRAVRPSDVVKAHSGKTIEIVNTDAEGRLILADALSYVKRFKPAAVLDAATLTGAALVALGQTVSAVMGNDDALIEEVRRAGERAAERVWPLPMYDEYRELNKSDIADVKNSGGRYAGTISAGWFLREFAEGYPWVHLDVAGTAYTGSDTPPLAKGPAGVPMRLFVEFLLGRAG